MPKATIVKRLLLKVEPPVLLSPQDCGYVVSYRVTAEAALKRGKQTPDPPTATILAHV